MGKGRGACILSVDNGMPLGGGHVCKDEKKKRGRGTSGPEASGEGTTAQGRRQVIRMLSGTYVQVSVLCPTQVDTTAAPT